MSEHSSPLPSSGGLGDLVQTAPSPIALAVDRLVRAEEPVARLEGALRTAEVLGRYASIVALSVHLGAPGRDESVARAAEEWARTGGGDELLAALHPGLSDSNPFGRAVRAFYRGAELEGRMLVRDIVDGREVNREIGTLAQMASLRRELPVDLHSIPRAQLPGTADFARVLLDRVLSAARGLLELRLVRGEQATAEGPARPVSLAGPGEPRPGEILPATPLAADQVQLIDPVSGEVLSLHPFVVHHDCYYCLKEEPQGSAASPREVFLFERASAARVYYRGARHSVALREFHAALRERLGGGRPGTVRIARPVDDFDAALAGAAERTLENLRGSLGDRVTDRATWQPRHAAQAQLERFLESQGTSMLVLTGEAGIGKTSLAGRVATGWVERGHCVLYSSLEGAERLDLLAELEALVGTRAWRDEILSRFERDDRRRIVLVLDSLDRAAQPLAVAESIRRFVEEVAARNRAVRVVLPLRDVFHEEAVEEGLAGLFTLPARLYHATRVESMDGPRDVPAVRLERLDPKETEALYEALRRAPAMHPKPAFHELRRAARNLFAHPERARLAAASFHERDLPHPLTLEGLLDPYSTRVLFRTRERRDFLEALVETLYRGRSESIPVDQLIESADDGIGRQILENSPRSAYAGLLEEKVLARRVSASAEADQESVGFVEGTVFDFLLYRYLHRRYEDSDEILVELTRGTRRMLFPGALQHLLARRLAGGSAARLERLLERGGTRLERLATRTLLLIDEYTTPRSSEDEGSPLARLAHRLIETRHAGARRIVGRLSEGLFAAGRIEDAAEIASIAADAAEAAGEPAGPPALRAGGAAIAAGDLKTGTRHVKRALKLLKKGEDAAALARANSAMAEIEIRSERPKKALGWVDAALAAAEDVDDPGLRLSLHRMRARILDLAGQADKSIEEIDRAIDLAGRLGDKARQADLYLERGERTLAAGAHEQAGFFLERAVHLARSTGDPVRNAAALDRLGEFHRKRGHREAALSVAREALAIRESLGRSSELVGLLCQVGADLEALDQRDEAADLYRRAKAAAKEMGDDPGLARAYHRLGGLHYAEGAHGKALDEYAKALELWKRLGERAQMGGIYHNIGMLQQAQGDNAKALEYFKRSEAIKRELGDEAGSARTANHIARIHAAWKEYGLAFECLDRAIDVLFAQKDWASLATSHNVRGQILAEMEKYQEALAAYAKSAQILESIGDSRGLAACLNNIALVHKARGDLHQALKHFQQAAAIQEKIGDRRGLAATYNNIGVVHDSRGDYDHALEYYQKDLELSRSIGDRRGVATTLNNIAILHSNHRQYAKALVGLEECLGLCKDLKDQDMEDRIRERIRRVKEMM